MKNLPNKILHIFLLLAFFSSCSQKKPATIIIKSKEKYSKENSHNKNKYNSEEELKTSKNGAVIVGSGDTIYSIAQKNKVPMRELISANNLTPPYNLKKGSKIILPKAKFHQVALGETLYSISRIYDMNINNLIKINNLEEPYRIKVGDRLRIAENKEINKEQIIKNVKKEEEIPDEKKIKLSEKPEKPLENKAEIKIEKKPSKENKFIWPVNGKIISKFGYKKGGLYNDGVNIKANKGDPVRATEDGTIAYVGNELRGYGNLIIMKHENGWISAYAHLEKSEVKRGDKVKKGHLIARVGSTGNVDSPQLYFGVRKGREAVNPQLYVKSVKTKLKSDS